jgi:hypothetical protein
MSSSGNRNPPSSVGSGFVNILNDARETYERRTGENLNFSTYLGSMKNYHTLDEFRRLIQDQARDLRIQFLRTDFLLTNRLVTRHLSLCVLQRLSLYIPVANVVSVAIGVLFDVCIFFDFSKLPL